jgi:hypothetical protein
VLSTGHFKMYRYFALSVEVHLHSSKDQSTSRNTPLTSRYKSSNLLRFNSTQCLSTLPMNVRSRFATLNPIWNHGGNVVQVFRHLNSHFGVNAPWTIVALEIHTTLHVPYNIFCCSVEGINSKLLMHWGPGLLNRCFFCLGVLFSLAPRLEAAGGRASIKSPAASLPWLQCFAVPRANFKVNWIGLFLRVGGYTPLEAFPWCRSQHNRGSEKIATKASIFRVSKDARLLKGSWIGSLQYLDEAS